MKTFKKWDGKMLEDCGSYMSDEAKSFYRAFKNYLKRSFPNAELVGFKPNHYDTSGFIVQDGKIIYVSHSLDRRYGHCECDFRDSSCMNGVLYRTAKSTKDYTGGANHFCSIEEMACMIRYMFQYYEQMGGGIAV